MHLKERSYSVLVVSSKETFNASLASLLPESTYHTVHTVSGINAAKMALAERAFDFVLVNSPLPDDTGIRFAIDTCLSGETVVLLLVKNALHDEIYGRVAPHGVFTLPKPTSTAIMSRALNWMISAREQLRHFEKKSLSIEQKMEEIRLVNKAKWLLISQRKMSEPDAHRYIEKQAMDSCISKKSVAENIVKTYS